jgi:CubicO group peptidase (beta-lactamase class C family)
MLPGSRAARRRTPRPRLLALGRTLGRVLGLALGLALGAPGGARAQLPTTPAGRQLAAWLDATNRADRAALQAFVDASQPGFTVDQALAMSTQTGGLDVRKVQESSDTRIVVLAQERGPARQFVTVTLSVRPGAPDRVAGIAVQPTEPPPELAPPPLTAAEAEAARRGAPFRQLAAYLDALGAGDRERLRRFLETTYPSANVGAQTSFAERTGGFELRALERATATTASGLVQERTSDQFARFTIVVDSAPPHRITRLALAAIPRPAAFPIARLGEAELVSALRSKLQADAEAGRFAGTVLLARLGDGRGRVVFSGAYGQADRERAVPNALDTKLRIGSMNKMFTATAILQLAQAGRVELDAPLGTYVPDYPNKDVASKVTIHHLLTHTGGTGDIFGPQFAARRLELRTLADYVALYGTRGLAFEPGSRWQYSNYGMLLLGVVVERVTGESYYDYVAKHVYAPAGMTHSGSAPEDEAVTARSVGYMRQNGAWTPNTGTLPYRGTAAGGGYSTVGDLLRFAEALTSHRLLDAEHTELLLGGKADVADGVKYAYGFEDARRGGVRVVGHGGGAPGMNGELRILPQSGWVVAVLSNLDPPAASRVWQFIEARLPR